MSNPKFVVFKLKDLKIPILILLIAIALIVLFLFKGKSATQTFAPADTYQDGKYIAGISLSDAELELTVEVQDGQITSVSLDGLDQNTTLYHDLTNSLNYVNAYVTATQSFTLPVSANATGATIMLMDAVKIALSDEIGTEISSTYGTTPSLSQPSDLAENASNALSSTTETDYSALNDVFVDEFLDNNNGQPTIISSSDDLTFEEPTTDIDSSVEDPSTEVSSDNMDNEAHPSALEESIDETDLD